MDPLTPAEREIIRLWGVIRKLKEQRVPNDFLLRVWGRDQDAVAKAFRPDDIEDSDGPRCYWFPTAAARAAFRATLADMEYYVVAAEVNPGEDDYGEVIDTHRETIARVTLRLPDGRTGTYDQSFGYGYPKHGVEFMYEDGNYACDCNRELFLERLCDITLTEDPDAQMCGHTIELVSLEIL